MEFEWQQEVDSLDGVPEKFRGLYAKGEGGKFTLDGDLAKRLDTSGLTSALEKERRAAKEAKAALSGYSKFGKPEDIQTKLAELEKAATTGKEGASTWEKLKADMEAGHRKVLEEKDAEIAQQRAAVRAYLVDTEATRVLTEAKGSVRLLLPHIKTSCVVVEEGDGKDSRRMVVRVVDAEGEPRLNGKGGYMTIGDLVAEMKKSPDFARAFEPSGTSGSGTPPGGSKGGTPGANKTALELIQAGLNQR